MNVLQLIPDKLARLIVSYLTDGRDGNVTIHFAKGRIDKWEYKMVEKP